MNEKRAAIEAKNLLQARLSGMFDNSRKLYEKNTALLDKLTAMVEAGGFSCTDRLYIQDIEVWKGQALEQLYEYTHGA